MEGKKSIFDNPLLSTKVKSANAKIFPEGVLGYFIGPTLALLSNSILNNYLTKYMTDVLNMSVWASAFLTWLPVISVIFVVLGNILVGRLMDHSRTKAGKARPLLLLSVPLSLLALLMLFVISPFSTDTINPPTQIWTLVCLAIGYNLWYAVAYPCYFTSHAALVSLSTRNSKDRSLLATISNATTLAAVGICSMILPFFLKFLLIENADGSTNQSDSYNAWKIFVIALIIITAVGVLIEYFFTRERITEEAIALNQKAEKKASTPLGKQVKICFKDKFWWIMIVFFFLYQLGGMLKNCSQIYYCQAMWFDDYNSLLGTLNIVGAIPTALGMVIAWPLSNKIGKGRAILFGAILSAIGGAMGFIAPDNFYMAVTAFCIKALGSTPAMYLSLALLADMLDHQEAMHGVRTDGFTMTIYGAIMAGMTGIATGIIMAVINANGYDAASLESTITAPAMQSALTWVYFGGEMVCYGVMAILFIFMGVEKFGKFDHKAIVMDQKAKAEADGVEYVDPAERMKKEEAEAELASDEARKAELKAKCEKKGLNFEEEEAKYQKALAEKQAAAEAKKQAAAEKKAAAEKLAAEKYAALSDAQKAEIEAKKKAKEEKREAYEERVLAEFNKLRTENGRPTL